MPKKKASRSKRTTKKPASFKLSIKNILTGLAVLILLGAALYSYQYYRGSDIEKEGIVICNRQGECEKSLHIHSALLATICGETQNLLKDTGELADLHTHKQSNVLHFHERLKVTPAGEIVDSTPLTLENATRAVLGLELEDNECIGEYCNGDRCPNGRPGTLSLTVVEGFCNGDSCPGKEEAQKAVRERGEIQENIADYVWKDGQLLYLTFE